MMSLSALSLAFFVSTFTDKEQLVSAVVNVVSLGMSFLCGVFVSMDVLGKVYRKLPSSFRSTGMKLQITC